MKRKGDWIQTYTGLQFWPIDPKPEDVCIEDIAHALSNLCRYNGHTEKFYSVAEHSIYVSYYVGQQFALVGLLHDAAEAYLSDVPRPIKPYLKGYKEIEHTVSCVIFERMGIIDKYKFCCGHIKAVDNAILADEAYQVMGKAPAAWYLAEPPLGIEIQCWAPEKAKKLFLKRYYDIKDLNHKT